MFQKFIDYFNLQQVRGLELFFASILILSSYSLWGLPLQIIIWLLLLVFLLIKPKVRQFPKNKPLTIMVLFVLLHDFLYLFIANGNINAYIQQVTMFGCLFLAVKVFNIDKLKGSINLVAIIAIIGLLYQWGVISAGKGVHPIQLPFLDMPQNRLEGVSIRPSSFFMEPAAYVAFMYIPLAFSLIDRKFLWTLVIILSEFLTTSTTGLLTSFIMLIVYIFTQKVNFKIRFFSVVMGAAMLFALTNFNAFQTGVNKLEDTNIDTNMRLAQGPYVVSTMQPKELIAGAVYHNAYNYCLAGRAPDVVFYENEVYMSTIWMIILKYGFMGLVLYFMFYLKIAKEDRKTLPLIVCLIAVMFSSGYGFGGTYIYTSISLMLIFIYNKNKLEYDKK